MDWVEDELRRLADTTSEYREFNARILATVDPATVLGVRVPALRRLARTVGHSADREAFLAELPHRWYEEYLLHAFVLNEERGLEATVARLEALLPFVDNWCVCDALVPRAFRGQPAGTLVPLAEGWMSSPHEYTRRFGVSVPMRFLLGEGYDPSQLERAVEADDGRYYVRMEIAWYLAEAMVGHWDDVVPLLMSGRMDRWTHNKAIQKAVESRRIPDDRKAYLKTLRRRM